MWSRSRDFLAAEDPQEDRTCVQLRWCSTGAAEDGRAPTEERACRRSGDFCSRRRAEDAIRQKQHEPKTKRNHPEPAKRSLGIATSFPFFRRPFRLPPSQLACYAAPVLSNSNLFGRHLHFRDSGEAIESWERRSCNGCRGPNCVVGSSFHRIRGDCLQHHF